MTLDDFVRVVRRMLPKVVGTEPGLRTRGWWRDHDGNVHTDLVSGERGDPLFGEARELLESLGAPREALDLAAHVEIKLATLMRRQRQPDAELVINNVVRGSLSPELRNTCDKVLPKILHAGQRLTVEGIDEWGERHSRTYEGEE